MEPKKNWFRRHIYLTVFLVLFGIPIMIGIIGSTSSNTSTTPSNSSAAATPTEPVKEKVIIPVEITSTKIVRDSVGTPILNVTVKNTSKKTIDALTVLTYFANNYDEPVGKWGAKSSDPFAGIIQQKILPNGTFSSEWNLAVYDTATKATGTQIYKVHFTDGSTLSLE